MISVNFEIHKKETSLAIYNEDLPEVVKIYLVCKKVEGLSQQTLDTYLRMLRLFFREINKPLQEITTNEIRLYLFSYQQQRGCSNRSLDKYRQYLACFFSWATDNGYLQRNPMCTIPAIRYEKKSRENLTHLELEYLRQSCRTLREHAVVEFLYSTGCRASELCGVKLSDVDWNARTVHILGKGSKHRVSFINAKAEVAVKSYLKSREDDSEYLFVTERKPYRQLKRDALEKIIRAISSRLSGEVSKRVTPHILRHTTATLALQSGMPITDVSKFLGHEKIDTTMIYVHASMNDIQVGHKKFVV